MFRVQIDTSGLRDLRNSANRVRALAPGITARNLQGLEENLQDETPEVSGRAVESLQAVFGGYDTFEEDTEFGPQIFEDLPATRDLQLPGTQRGPVIRYSGHILGVYYFTQGNFPSDRYRALDKHGNIGARYGVAAKKVPPGYFTDPMEEAAFGIEREILPLLPSDGGG